MGSECGGHTMEECKEGGKERRKEGLIVFLVSPAIVPKEP